MRFFVTGATGDSGFAVATMLLSRDQQVNALTRNPDSAQAKQLASLGAKVVKGDFSDVEALTAGVDGCDGIYLLTTPGDPTSEQQQANNVLDAARTAGGVKAVVSSTVARAEEHEMFRLWSPEKIMAPYWIGKTEVQKSVQDSGMAWCILQPTFFMKNFLPPISDFYWPELKAAGVLLSAFSPEMEVQLTAPEDVGRFATEALLCLASGNADAEAGKWNGNIIRVASDEMKMSQIAATMSGLSGKQITAKFRSQSEVETLLENSHFVTAQVWLSEHGTKADIAKCKSYGIKMTNFEEFLRQNPHRLAQALSS